MLGQAELVPYLLKRGLISARSVVQGDLTILDVSRRNHNVAVLCEHGPSLLVKQGADAIRIAGIASEAAIYRFLDTDARGRASTACYLARFVGYDPDEHLLMLEFLSNARTLQEHHIRFGRFSRQTASLLGRALSAFHRLASSGLTPRRPWVLSFHQPEFDTICNFSEANIGMTKIIQQDPEFPRLLDKLRSDWEPTAFVHSDVRWENCLVSPVARKNAPLKIIDWELAGLGDPMWDVGSVFAAYLSFWLFFAPITSFTQPDHFLPRARYPLERMQPAIRSFWYSYIHRREVLPETAERLLNRAVRYCAARLVQTSFEQMQISPELTAHVIYAVQLSLNILKRPKEASAVLLNLPELLP